MEQRYMGTGDTPGIGMETGRKGLETEERTRFGTEVTGCGGQGHTLHRLCPPFSAGCPHSCRVGRTLWGIARPPSTGPPHGKWPGQGHRGWPAAAGGHGVLRSGQCLLSPCPQHFPRMCQQRPGRGWGCSASLSPLLHPGCSRSCFHDFCGMKDGVGPCSHTGQLWGTAGTPRQVLGSMDPCGDWLGSVDPCADWLEGMSMHRPDDWLLIGCINVNRSGCGLAEV